MPAPADPFALRESNSADVAIALELTERRRAEERLRELESDLAHMNRLSIMGGLAASLAHEITQPIASARNNARAALNFLNQQPPDLREVGEALGCIVRDADRARDIIDRIRAHIRKAPPRKHCFDLNEAAEEAVGLARSVIVRTGVSVQTRLTAGLAPVEGDRVQLQQVILNLILNATEAMSAVDEGTRQLSISTGQGRTLGVLVAVRDSAQALTRTISSAYSKRSTPPSPAEWGWGCRFAGRSSTPTGGACGRRQTSPEAPSFSSPCRVRTWNSRNSQPGPCGNERPFAFRARPNGQPTRTAPENPQNL